ncbi:MULTISPECIES: hypothetical protein [unclassified Rickettsia]|uniref:hypothetical protein n=1 Tax=unclassified Rickettsia TaxID=114295 RepID=UPI003132C85A
MRGYKFIANSTMSFRDLFTESRKIYKQYHYKLLFWIPWTSHGMTVEVFLRAMPRRLTAARNDEYKYFLDAVIKSQHDSLP